MQRGNRQQGHWPGAKCASTTEGQSTSRWRWPTQHGSWPATCVILSLKLLLEPHERHHVQKRLGRTGQGRAGVQGTTGAGHRRRKGQACTHQEQALASQREGVMSQRGGAVVCMRGGLRSGKWALLAGRAPHARTWLPVVRCQGFLRRGGEEEHRPPPVQGPAQPAPCTAHLCTPHGRAGCGCTTPTGQTGRRWEGWRCRCGAGWTVQGGRGSIRA